MATQRTDYDVLVVGGGPTGVTLGLIAAQHGATVLICERTAEIYPLPRAAHVDHEVMRIFQSVGAASAIARTSRCTDRYDFLTADGEVLLRFDNSAGIGPGGWPGANMIHQPSVEQALRARITHTPGVTLRNNASLTGFVEHPDHVSAALATDTGNQTVTTRFLVGADGTRSPTRAMAGIELDDLKFDEPWLVVDAIVHDFERLPKVNLQLCDPARPTTCVLMGEGRHRWEFMLLPGETAEDVLDEAFVDALLKPWNVEGAVSLERKAVYRFNARVARQWRKGRILLAGDAAHQTPPFAGQGLCAGARDASNLGWKLGAIAQERALEAVLDSYQQEREPHVRATIEMAITMGRTVCMTDPEAAQERNRQMLEQRAAGTAGDGGFRYPEISSGLILEGSAAAGRYFPQPVTEARDQRLDDVLGRGPWLICAAAANQDDRITTVSLTEPRIAPFAATLEDWLRKHDADAVLVRPDGYVFGTGSTEQLCVEWFKQLGG